MWNIFFFLYVRCKKSFYDWSVIIDTEICVCNAWYSILRTCKFYTFTAFVLTVLATCRDWLQLASTVSGHVSVRKAILCTRSVYVRRGFLNRRRHEPGRVRFFASSATIYYRSIYYTSVLVCPKWANSLRERENNDMPIVRLRSRLPIRNHDKAANINIIIQIHDC